ncbi:2'-5' RNA ligase family protein [Kribbella sp. CA-247076]|uniref:2'-5' RNA ligase family protein n=1 Tax=Kribbella sp. CA-247076 TaxID=3239941 RepID=UPI003D8FC5BE
MSDAWAGRNGLTAILITAPELADFTDRWRSVSRSSARPHVSLSELIPPHVTVLIPWVADPDDADVRRLEEAVSTFEPFELSFPTAGEFPGGTAWLKPEPFDKVRSLLFAVYGAFPECPPYGGEFPDPHPHLTISAGSDRGSDVVREASAALAETPAPTTVLTELGLWHEGDDGVWRQFGAVAL